MYSERARRRAGPFVVSRRCSCRVRAALTRVAGATALAALAVVLAGGCASAAALRVLDDGETTVCAPADELGRAAFGISTVQNTTADEIVVVGAEPIRAEGVELLGVELRPADEEDSYGVGVDYAAFGPRAAGERAAIPAGEQRVVVVGLQHRGGAVGAADGVRQRTQRADGSWTALADTRIALQVVAAGSTCR